MFNHPGQLILHRFHGACVDITEEVAEKMELKNEKFFCEPCEDRVQGKTHYYYSQYSFFWPSLTAGCRRTGRRVVLSVDKKCTY